MAGIKTVAALAMLLLAPVTALAAKPAVISGTVKTKPSTSRFQFPHVIRAVQAVPPYEMKSVTVPPGGKFKLSVKAGPHVVVTNTWRGDARGYKTSRKFVVAKGGKTVKLQSGLTRVANIPLPSGPVISVGNVRFLDSNGQSIKTFDGRDMRFDDSLIGDLAAQNGQCKFHVVEDREFGRFGEVLKEIRLQSSRHFDSRTRRSLKSSLQTLALWAPQYRLTGTITTNSDGVSMSADLKLIELATGKVVWCRRMTFPADNLFGSFSANVAAAVSNTLCGAVDLPAEVSGSFSGAVADPLTGMRLAWSGNTTYRPTDLDPLDGAPAFLGVGILTVYRADSANITEWDVSGGNAQCTYSGHESGVSTNSPTGVLFVEITPEGCSERRYGFASIFDVATPATLRVVCDGTETELTRPWGVSLQSSNQISEMPQFSGDSAQGNYVLGPSNWSWNMTVTPQ